MLSAGLDLARMHPSYGAAGAVCVATYGVLFNPNSRPVQFSSVQIEGCSALVFPRGLSNAPPGPQGSWAGVPVAAAAGTVQLLVAAAIFLWD